MSTSARMDPVVLGVRATALAVVTMVLGVAGHVGAGGLLPGTAGLLLLFVGTLGAGAALLARPATTRRLVALVVGGQTLVHGVLSVGGGHAGEQHRPAVALGGGHGGPAGHGGHAGHADRPTLPLGELLADVGDHASMAVAHLLVAVVVGWWLAVGEQALWTLLTLAAALVLRPLAVLGALARAGLPLVRRLPAGFVEVPGGRRPLLLARCLSRRGPPALLV